MQSLFQRDRRRDLKKLWLLLVVVSMFISCDDDSSKSIVGTLTREEPSSAGDYYVYLDNDADVTNGYEMRIVGQLEEDQADVDYFFDTTNVPDGSYYLLAGYDEESVDNMDPEDLSVWEGRGWYGSDNGDPPASPNVTDLDGRYDMTIYGLN